MRQFLRRPPPHQPPEQPDDPQHTLLHALLQQPVPRERERLRPVVLRSVQEQRRVALHSYLLRNWIDRLLPHVERVLLLALVLVLAGWAGATYGRDWLTTLDTPAAASFAPATDTIDTAAPGRAAADAAAAPPEPAASADVPLPFVPPDVAAEADYIAPRPAAQLPRQQDVSPAVPTAPAPATQPTQPTSQPASAALPAPQGDPRPRRLRIPALAADIPVQEVFVADGVWQVADYAAGYHHGTALPGATGNLVMAGHAGVRGAVFRDLGALQPGDMLLVETEDWRFRYQVRMLRSVWPTQIEVMEPTATPVVTLITCTAWDTKRLIVIADLIDVQPLASTAR